MPILLLRNFDTPGVENNNACPMQTKIASSKLFFGLTCPMGKLPKCNVLSNIKQNKQDYLEMQFRSAFGAMKQ